MSWFFRTLVIAHSPRPFQRNRTSRKWRSRPTAATADDVGLRHLFGRDDARISRRRPVDDIACGRIVRRSEFSTAPGLAHTHAFDPCGPRDRRAMPVRVDQRRTKNVGKRIASVRTGLSSSSSPTDHAECRRADLGAELVRRSHFREVLLRMNGRGECGETRVRKNQDMFAPCVARCCEIAAQSALRHRRRDCAAQRRPRLHVRFANMEKPRRSLPAPGFDFSYPIRWRPARRSAPKRTIRAKRQLPVRIVWAGDRAVGHAVAITGPSVGVRRAPAIAVLGPARLGCSDNQGAHAPSDRDATCGDCRWSPSTPEPTDSHAWRRRHLDAWRRRRYAQVDVRCGTRQRCGTHRRGAKGNKH